MAIGDGDHLVQNPRHFLQAVVVGVFNAEISGWNYHTKGVEDVIYKGRQGKITWHRRQSRIHYWMTGRRLSWREPRKPMSRMSQYHGLVDCVEHRVSVVRNVVIHHDISATVRATNT
jgi:hypothetical protein